MVGKLPWTAPRNTVSPTGPCPPHSGTDTELGDLPPSRVAHLYFISARFAVTLQSPVKTSRGLKQRYKLGSCVCLALKSEKLQILKTLNKKRFRS